VRILLISESFGSPGGWATYAKNLAAGLKQQGHNVMIYSAESAGVFPALPSPIQTLSHPFRTLVRSWRLRSALQKFPPDVIHITTEPYALLTALWPRALLKRTVMTIHGSYGVRLLQRWTSRHMLKRAFANLPAFITVSAYTKKRVGEELSRRTTAGLAQKFLTNAQVIYNAIEKPQSTAQKTKGPQELRQILLIGPVKPRKGVLEAVEACALYRQKYGTPFVLRIIGTKEDSPYTQRVQQRMRELRLQDCIRFEGVLSAEKLTEAYGTADLLLLPTRTTENTFEGFGLVYIEAASYGVPSIGPDDSGAAEAVDEGRSGYRVHPTDATAIAERMHWILDEHRISPETCRAWAERFSIQNMTKAMDNLYGTLKHHTA